LGEADDRKLWAGFEEAACAASALEEKRKALQKKALGKEEGAEASWGTFGLPGMKPAAGKRERFSVR